MTFLINVFYYNELAWFQVSTDDHKSYSLTLAAFNAPHSTPPPQHLYIWQSLGVWCSQERIGQDFLEKVGAAVAEATKG